MDTTSFLAFGALSIIWLLGLMGMAVPLDAFAQPAPDQAPVVLEIEGDIEPDALVRVKVSGLQEWANSERQSAWRLVPHVDGRPLKGIYPSGVSLREGWLQFHLRVTQDNESGWVDLLSPPTFHRFVAFSVGPEQGDAFASRYQAGSDRFARVIVIRPGWAATAAVLVVACTLGFVYLAKHTRLLYEPAPPAGDASRLRLSLAKVQFALWFFAIFIAFLVIWLTTGRIDSLNSSVVAILGISSGTALGESFLRNPSGTADACRTERPVDQSGPPPRLWDHLKDLACDAHGASIYRFQVLAWTAVLLVTFASQVYFDLRMPVFGSELLYLLGLSSGTYIAQGVPGTRKWDAPAKSPAPMPSAAPLGMPTPGTTTSPPQDAGNDATARLAGLAQRMRSGEAEQPRAPP